MNAPATPATHAIPTSSLMAASHTPVVRRRAHEAMIAVRRHAAMSKGLLVAGMALLLPSLLFAGIENAGTTSANFLSLGTGARALGMGGATLGSAGDLNATAWNPAALGGFSDLELMFSHASLADETAQEWVTAAGRWGASPVRWSLSGVFQNEGSFEGRDASNNSTGSFEVASMAAGGQIASRLGEHVSVGLGFKWAHESLGPDVVGNGIAFDAGLLVQAGDLGFGFAAQNVGGKMTFDSRSCPFPANVGVGVAYTHRASGMHAALDYNVPSAYYGDVRGGLEWRWKDHLALRTGYRRELGAEADDPLGGPSFGIGAGAAGLWFDYGYVLAGSGDVRHRMGVSFSPARLGWGMGSAFGKRAAARTWDEMMLVGPPPPRQEAAKKR